MVVNFPILQVPAIAEPCTQSWEQMPGTARIRHCAACNQDVVNLAAMSSAEITRLLDGPVPCLRIARYDDGTLVTTEPVVKHALPRIAAGLLTAAMALGAAAQSNADPRNQNVLLGAPPVAPQPMVTGIVTDHSGQPITHATATLLQHGRLIATVKLGPDGRYVLTAPTAGVYDLRIEAPESTSATTPVELSLQKPVTKTIELAPRYATMGKIAAPPAITLGRIARPPKATAPKTIQPHRTPSPDLTLKQ